MSSADAGVLQRQKAKVKRQTRVPVFLFTFYLTAERWHSGLVHRSRKPEWLYGHGGFESPPLRQKCRRQTLEFHGPLMSDVWYLTSILRKGAVVASLAASEMPGSGTAAW